MRLREEVSALEVNQIDGRQLIGRVEAARQMGMTVSGLRYYEPAWFEGAKVRCQGIIYYERGAYEAFRASRAERYVGSAECFELFSEGLSPHAVVRRLNHPRPMLVGKLYEEHLTLMSLENCAVIRFDAELSLSSWKAACGLPPDEPIHGAYAQRALELVSFHPDYRERCWHAVRVWNEKQKRARVEASRLARLQKTAANAAPRKGRRKRATDPSRSAAGPSQGAKRARSQPPAGR